MTHLKRAIQESKEREEKATKGPWKANHGLIECTFSNGNTYRIATIDFGETMKRLTEILKRCEAATPYAICGPRTSKLTIEHKGTLEFIRHARSDLPLVTQALMKAVEGLKAVEEEMNMLACIPEYDGEDANIARVSINKITSTIAEIEKLLLRENYQAVKEGAGGMNAIFR